MELKKILLGSVDGKERMVYDKKKRYSYYTNMKIE
jgi:hypothetical protein